MLFLGDGSVFATGALTYQYRPLTEGASDVRVILQVLLDGLPAVCVLDTGAPYVIIAPSLAPHLGFDPANALERARIRHRDIVYNGGLHRLTLEFPAERGAALTVQATAFVPEQDGAQAWIELPSFLGMAGCLERLRFALDPGSDAFYFGPLGEG